MVDYTFPTPPIDHPNSVEHRRELANAIILLFDGKTNAIGTVTFATSAATTTITDERIGVRTVVDLYPTNADAAGEIGIWQTYPNATLGQAVINHMSDARTRTWVYTLHG